FVRRFARLIRAHSFSADFAGGMVLVLPLADAWGLAPRRSTMSRPIFRSILGAVAASLLIAAAGACTRDNPSNPNRPGSGGTAGGTTGNTGGNGTAGSGGTTAGGN